MAPDKLEQLIRLLACAIDDDEPPGLAAMKLARAAVALVRKRSGREALDLERALNRLAFEAKFDRSADKNPELAPDDFR